MVITKENWIATLQHNCSFFNNYFMEKFMTELHKDKKLLETSYNIVDVSLFRKTLLNHLEKKYNFTLIRQTSSSRAI